MEQGVILESFAEQFPSDRIDGAIRTGVEEKHIAVCGVGDIPVAVAAIQRRERIGKDSGTEDIPIVETPVEEALDRPMIENETVQSDFREGGIDEVVQIFQAGTAAIVAPSGETLVQEVADVRKERDGGIGEFFAGERDI